MNQSQKPKQSDQIHKRGNTRDMYEHTKMIHVKKRGNTRDMYEHTKIVVFIKRRKCNQIVIQI
jgi:hypothetical protein